jgi:pimeloyl-ACP methyl ester carboxylesterase
VTNGEGNQSRRGGDGTCRPGRASFALAAASGGAALFTAALTRRAERDYPPSGRFVNTGGVRLHVVDRGSGPAVVLVHGLRGSTRDFEHSILDALAVRYRAIAVDRPGYGHSERPPGTMGDSPMVQAELLHDALQQLGVERPIIVGHSMAAAVALSHAVRFPAGTGAVVTLCGHVFPFDGFGAGPLAVLATTPLVGRALAATVLAPLGLLVAPALLRHFFAPQSPPADYARAAIRLALRPRAFVASAEDRRSMDAGLQQIYKDFPTLRAPLVIVTGRADHVLGPAESLSLHRLVPGSELIVLRDSGHMPHFADPEAVIAAIDRAARLSAG